jgi:GNAT superfamily N-acetyltransferase
MDPSRFPLLTTELAERIERSVPEGKIASYAVEDRRFGHTVALRGKGGRGQWLNGVYCFGARDLDRLDAILDFYHGDGIGPPAFYLAPTHFTSGVAASLRDAGYAQSGFTQAMLYGVPSPMPPLDSPPISDITIEPVAASTAEEFAETTARGFGWPTEWREGAKAGIVQRIKTDRSFHGFLARHRGEPVGGGALDVRNNAAALIHGSVAPEFRRKGVHAALLRHRLHAAHALGCDLIIGGAEFGSTSLRNQLRAGLRIAYVESTWTARENS